MLHLGEEGLLLTTGGKVLLVVTKSHTAIAKTQYSPGLTTGGEVLLVVTREARRR